MKIDLNIISIIIIAITISPYILLPYLQYCSKKKMRAKFNQMIDNNKLNIDIEESWNFNIIGTDLKQKKILFVQKRDEDFIAEIINFSEIEECNVRPEIYKVNYRGKAEDILYKVDLEFFLNSQERVLLNLYDCDINYTQDLEIKRAERWCGIIRQHLSAKPVLKFTA